MAKPKKVAAKAKEFAFEKGDFVVYPTHGVGRIQKVDEQEVAGHTLELFVIAFEKDKMILRVPTTKAKAVGMRKLSSPDVVTTALNTASTSSVPAAATASVRVAAVSRVRLRARLLDSGRAATVVISPPRSEFID